MAKKNGFENMADFLGNISKVDMRKVTMESLEEAANFYLEQLKPNIPKSKYSKEHMRDHVSVTVNDDSVAVAFDDEAYYWRFVENGTPKQKAQLFASKTYKKNREKIEAIMVKKIQQTWEG